MAVPHRWRIDGSARSRSRRTIINESSPSMPSDAGACAASKRSSHPVQSAERKSSSIRALSAAGSMDITWPSKSVPLMELRGTGDAPRWVGMGLARRRTSAASAGLNDGRDVTRSIPQGVRQTSPHRRHRPTQFLDRGRTTGMPLSRPSPTESEGLQPRDRRRRCSGGRP